MVIWLLIIVSIGFSSGIEEDKKRAMMKINEARQVVIAMGVAGGSNAELIMQSANYELDNLVLELELAKTNKDVQNVIAKVEKKRKSYAESIKRLSKLNIDNMFINHL